MKSKIGFRPPEAPIPRPDPDFIYGYSAGVMWVLSGFMISAWKNPAEREKRASQIEDALNIVLSKWQDNMGKEWAKGYKNSVEIIVSRLRNT